MGDDQNDAASTSCGSPWSPGGGGDASDDEDGDDVFESAVQRLLTSMLLKDRHVSAAECARRICACDFSSCLLPCVTEQKLMRGFVEYPYYKSAVHATVQRLHSILRRY